MYIFGKELHQTYSDVLQMPFYDISMILDKFSEDVKRQNEENERQEKQIASQQRSMKSMTDNMGKIPQGYGDWKMPEMPKMEMPKMETPNMSF